MIIANPRMSTKDKIWVIEMQPGYKADTHCTEKEKTKGDSEIKNDEEIFVTVV